MVASIDKLNKLRLNRLKQQKQEYEFLKQIYLDRGKDVADYDAKIDKINRIIQSLEKKDAAERKQFRMFARQDDLFVSLLLFVIFCAPLWKPVAWAVVQPEQWLMLGYELLHNAKQLLLAGLWTVIAVFAIKGFRWSLLFAQQNEVPPSLFDLPYINREGQSDSVMQFWSFVLLMLVWYTLLGYLNISFK